MNYPQEPQELGNKQNLPPDMLAFDDSQTDLSYAKNRIWIGLALAFIGYLIFLLGARPSLFGLDRSPVVGFVQISVFLLGLAIISLGGYMTLKAHWPEGQKTIAADIGSRLISTGYVICVFTGMADIFGLGSHPLPNVFFGPLQAQGLTLGIATIAIGFLLMIRFKRTSPNVDRTHDLEQSAGTDATIQKPAGTDQLNIQFKALFQ